MLGALAHPAHYSLLMVKTNSNLIFCYLTWTCVVPHH